MVVPWRELAAKADAAIDEQWGEQARFVPMRPDTYEGPSRDPDRNPVIVTGVLLGSGDQAVGLAGDHAGSPLIGRVAVGDLFFSVTTDQLDAFDAREGDRVEMLAPERHGEAFEVNRVPPAVSGRIKIALVKAPDE